MKQTTGNPRQALLRYGGKGMSAVDLIAVLLGASNKEPSVKRLAQELLNEVGGIVRLSKASAQELQSIPGIGAALAGRLVASFELGRLAVQESLPTVAVIAGPEDVFQRLRGRLAFLEQEVFMVLALDARGRVLDEVEIARGSVSNVEVHPREVFKPLIRRAAFACVVAHNHPSGDPEPSLADMELSDRLNEVGRLVGIPVLDHVVIASAGFRSMAERFADLG